MKSYIFPTIAVLILAGFAHGAPDATVHSISLPSIHIELKQGAGRQKTETLCAICHSVDYITMQPNFSRAVWTAEVNKMIKVMGAPINEQDAKTITDYLVAAYGVRPSQ